MGDESRLYWFIWKGDSRYIMASNQKWLIFLESPAILTSMHARLLKTNGTPHEKGRPDFPGSLILKYLQPCCMLLVTPMHVVAFSVIVWHSQGCTLPICKFFVNGIIGISLESFRVLYTGSRVYYLQYLGIQSKSLTIFIVLLVE